jgi:UDP-GlcNAc:undecaprenyl-phosphate GlcNAc-1-phosphate transferase
MDFQGATLYVYIVFFAFSLIFSLLINALLLKFSKNLGIRNIDESAIRWASQSKPALGGISFYIIFLFSIVFFKIMFKEDKGLDIQLIGFLISVSLGFLMGLADDAYNTKPFLKFITQIVCGCILAYTGTYIKIFENNILNYFLTILWVTGIMNSLNMLDNMDAITTMVSIFISLITVFIIGIYNGATGIYFIILIVVLSALLGFIYYNWYPSKIYMGDTGSQFIGIFLAGTSIMFLWNMPGDHHPTKNMFIVLLAYIIPISDTLTVVINRISKGKSPFIGGKDHTTHYLFFNGITERRIAILFAFISIISFLFVYFLIINENWDWVHISFTGAYLLLIFLSLFYTTKRKKVVN